MGKNNLSKRKRNIAIEIINYFQSKKDVENFIDIKEEFFIEFSNILENNKKKNKYNDPNYIKRPKSSFIYFLSDRDIREKIIKEDKTDESSLGIIEKPKISVLKEISKIWNSNLIKDYCNSGKFIESKTKSRYNFTELGNKYNKMYELDKDRYIKQLIEVGKYNIKTVTKSDKPRSVYHIFREYTVNKIKKAYPNILYYELLYRLGRAWETVKDRDKNGPYKDKEGTYDYNSCMNKFIEHSMKEKELGKRIEFNEEDYEESESIYETSSIINFE